MEKIQDELNIYNIFDLNIWHKIQNSFAEATGFAAILVDKDGIPIQDYSEYCDYCEKKSVGSECHECFLSDSRGDQNLPYALEPVIYHDINSPIDFAVPIRIQGEFIGAILAGQPRLHPKKIKMMELNRFPCLYNDEQRRIQDPKKHSEWLSPETMTVNSYRIRASAYLLYNLMNHIADMKLLNKIQEQLHEKEIQLSNETRQRSEAEAALKEADLKALQSQVNPHFLFNVLNTIGRLAAIEGATRTEDTVYQFADMMRYTLKSSRNDVVTIGEALDHVNNYLSIQKIRLGERLWYDITIDPEVEQVLCPSMIMQPFVENIIKYVIEPRIIGGRIVITARDCQDEVEILINDNGKGIPEEKTQQILNGTYSAEGRSTGLGIMNVNKRLKYYYGSDHGITIGTSPEGGTQIKIRIPKHNIEL